MAENRLPKPYLRWPMLVAGFNILLFLVGFLGGLFSPANIPFDAWIALISFYTGDLLYSIVGALILSRHPRHSIGRWFLVIGFLYALASFDGFIYALARTFMIQSETVRGLSALVIEFGFLSVMTLPMSIVLLYFPDGKLPSGRWKLVAVLFQAGVIGALLRQLFLPFSPSMQAEVNAGNPLAINGLDALLDPLGNLFSILIWVGGFGALVSLVIRYRRASGVERAQMKWLVYTAATTIILLSAFRPFLQGPLQSLVLILPILLAAAIGIAIMRYRLWDIDIIIRRTLSYSILTAVLGMIYFGGVVLLQNVFGSLFGNAESALVAVISTLAIAALFNPLRERIQNFIDRRFFRSKYDAEKALADFGAIARDEVDMSQLSGSLISVVETTMQPEQISLWLRDSGTRK